MTEPQRLADAIDALLPQTQCTRCGFDGCRPYAEAVVHGTAPINRCPPGGQPVLDALAGLLRQAAGEVDPDCGTPQPPRVALVEEPDCIGCAKCIDVCPTDAIVGARKWMHSVIAADCSGCELCIPACPVDCIVMAPAPGLPERLLDARQIAERAARFRSLYETRRARLARDAGRWRARLAARLQSTPGGEAGP